MVQETKLYTGDLIEGLSEQVGQGAIEQHMAYEPGSDRYWSAQGTYRTLDADGGPFSGWMRLTSGFWSQESFRFERWLLGPHGGNDWVGEGPIRPLCAGEVMPGSQDWNDGTGWKVETRIPNTSPQAYIGYYHLAAKPKWKPGDIVRRGDEIGEMGETGTFATGRHLHASGWTPVTPQHTWNNPVSKRYFDLLPYMGDMFRSPRPLVPGVNLVTFAGGLTNLLDYEGQEQDLSSVSVAVDGRFYVWVPNSPDFVNEQFLERFPDGWVPASEALLAVKRVA